MRSITIPLLLCLSLLGCDRRPTSAPTASPFAPVTPTASSPPPAAPQSPPIVLAARSQIGLTVRYDPAYTSLAYPNGDVPRDRGVCTDVVIRALRDALHFDLQKAVHEDMKSAFDQYPKLWGLSRPDRNIDHRRVPNLMRYFQRAGYSLPISADKTDYHPGDLVTCTVGSNLAHIMIVSDLTNSAGAPLVIHNIGSGTREEDRLFAFPHTGHFRIPAPR